MHRFLLAATLSFAIKAGAQPAPERWSILVPGDHHSDEAPAAPGSGWLALAVVNGAWRLEPVRVKAERFRDVLEDAKGMKTGTRITESRGDALVLLRLPSLKPGRVETPNMQFLKNDRQVWSGHWQRVRENDRRVWNGVLPLKIPFKGEIYEIEVKEFEVYVHKNGTRTLLPDLDAKEDTDTVTLIWAGDLDGDGKLDFLFRRNGPNSVGVCLFLSSDAPPGSLVRKVGCHDITGC
jgi:hypothetical protein